jgi:manganese/iron transport system substrate-binding protein
MLNILAIAKLLSRNYIRYRIIEVHMSKYLASLTAGLLVSALMLATSAQAQDGKKLKVITTFTVIENIAKNVAGDAAEVQSITKAGAEIHDYQPTPGDIRKAQSADLILWNGMNLELWFEKFFADLKNVKSIVVTENVKPISISQGPYEGKPNPHAWMSPENALIYVENIRKALTEADPANTETYNKNAAHYSEQIKAVLEPLKAKLADIAEEQRWLVTSEGAFSYLARDLGLKEVYLWPINADQQGTPQQVKKVIDTVRQNKIPVLFSESTISDRPAKQVAKETGAHYGGVLYVDSLSESNGKVPTYLKLLEVTTATIAEGFKNAK